MKMFLKMVAAILVSFFLITQYFAYHVNAAIDQSCNDLYSGSYANPYMCKGRMKR